MSEQPVEMVEPGADPVDDAAEHDVIEGATEDGTPVPSEWDSETDEVS